MTLLLSAQSRKVGLASHLQYQLVEMVETFLAIADHLGLAGYLPLASARSSPRTHLMVGFG